MRISDSVANYILGLLNEADGRAEIQRNELAELMGCVPSQINYVIKSRRGGGGYIRITRIEMDGSCAIMHTVNSIGNTLDGATARAMLMNLCQRDILEESVAKAIEAAISDRSCSSIPQEMRDALRADLFKNMLMTQI